MKNNRAVILETDFLNKNDIPKTSPAENSLFWKMWNDCKDIAEQALNTEYIQGIKTGTLSPTTFGAFNVNDAYYCFNGAEDYLNVSSRATDPILRGFLKQKHDSYAKYNDTFSQTWHIKDASSVVPTKVCQEYSEFETSVASQNEPIYTLVAMLPCEYLWAWIADQLKSYTSGNIYASWITGNDYFDGAYAMGNFLSAYQKNHSIDENLAMQIYQKAIEFEFQNFKTAM
ncbi:MAG: TenA family transcriptional regulator [Saprospiraceae bacterium]